MTLIRPTGSDLITRQTISIFSIPQTMILSPDGRNQLTQTGTNSVQHGPISPHESGQRCGDNSILPLERKAQAKETTCQRPP